MEVLAMQARKIIGAGTTVLLASLLVALPRPPDAYDIVDTISPTIAQNPIEVVIWVKPGVTSENETRVLTQIREGLNMWQAVTTSSLAFNVVNVAHSATEPPRSPQQLLIIVGNVADLTSGGASFPYGGNPGTWFGAVADNPAIEMRKVAAHEVGHAVGFHHSTVGETFATGTYPIMHWAVAGTSDQPTADDIAAASTAYPDPTQSLQSVTGTIRGRLVIAGTAIPVSGVNVVAVNQATGAPAVARLSGPRATPYGDSPDGDFELDGLPPGQYEVRYLDGHSYRGSIPAVRVPSDGISANGMRAGYQVDNFTPFSTANVTVGAGAVVNLGSVAIPLATMSFDGQRLGSLDANATMAPITSQILPQGQVGMPYELWLHIAGGLRDITADATGVPTGLAGSIAGDPRSWNVGVHGNHFFHVHGTPTIAGHKTIDITLRDLAGRTRTVGFNLSVGPLPGDGLIARYSFEGDTRDLSGNGHDAVNHGAGFTTDRNGRASSALAFDGVNDYLELPHEAAFDAPAFTIVAVLRLPDPRPTDDWIVYKGRRFGNYSLQRRGSSGTWRGYAAYTHETFGGNWSFVGSAASLPVGRFFCLAVSVSGSSFKSYVDGTLVRDVPSPATPRYNDEPVRVGVGGYYGPTEFMRGVIDELVIYRGVLDATAIRSYCS
jgi:hypothetical protein